MDEALRDKDRKLERLKIENEIEGERVSIAQKKALEREARQKYGRDWKKILGIVRSIKINPEALQTLHSMGVSGEELRDLSRPGGKRSRYK